MAAQSSIDIGKLVQDDAVNRRVYTDSALFELEMERLFGRTWIFLCHESEIPNPGDFKIDQIWRWPLLMTRDGQGRPRVFFNVCVHRGATVCHEAYGHGTSFRCPYHGWTYGSDGALIGIPLRERMRDLDPAAHGLRPVPRVESYQGFVFVSMSAQGISLSDHLGRAKHYLDAMVERAPEWRIEAVKPIKYSYRGNWKLQIENYSDNYHPSILHHSALSIGGQVNREKYSRRFTQAPAALPLERTFGHGHFLCDYRGSRAGTWLNAYDDEYVELLARKMGTERAREMTELDLHVIIYPNLLLHTRLNHFRVIKPIAVDYTEVDAYPCRLAGAPAAVNRRLIVYTSHHCSVAGEVQVDDIQAFNWVQQGLASGAQEWVVLKLHGEDERRNEHGEVEWHKAGEGAIRHQYREWLRMMLDGEAFVERSATQTPGMAADGLR